VTSRVPNLSLVPSPEQQPRRLPILSVTSANRYRSCPRSYYFANVLRRIPRHIDENRRFGTLLHVGLEAWWRAYALGMFSTMAPLDAALEAMRTSKAPDPYDLARAEVLMRGYDARWGLEQLEVVYLDPQTAGVEVEFEGDLRNPATSGVSRTFRRGGRIDAIVRAPDGQVYVMEHKSSSEDISAGSEYWQRLTLDLQCSAYMQGARDLGLRPAGVIYDVVGKPDMRPLRATPVESRKYVKKTGSLYANQREHDETPEEHGARLAERIAETPEKFYQRAYIVRTEQELCESAWSLWATSVQIRESMAANLWPQHDKSCRQYGRLCDYFAVCTKQASIDDDFRYKTKEKQ
jgi:RecB family exonuclease